MNVNLQLLGIKNNLQVSQNLEMLFFTQITDHIWLRINLELIFTTAMTQKLLRNMPINEKMDLFSVRYPFHKQVAKKSALTVVLSLRLAQNCSRTGIIVIWHYLEVIRGMNHAHDCPKLALNWSWWCWLILWGQNRKILLIWTLNTFYLTCSNVHSNNWCTKFYMQISYT